MRVLLLLMGAIALTACGQSKEAKITQQKREFVTQQMRDPGTVQFKAEKLNGQGWLCGQLNSKNAYGAYVGFKRFAVRDYDDAWIEGLGYSGKPDAQPTAHIIEALKFQTKVLVRIREVKTANADYPVPSKEQIDAMAESERFAERWAKHCA